MRSTRRVLALILVLGVLLAPLTTYASGGPCPDDPEGSANCAAEAPPYYVVINRGFERLGAQYGTGCQPWILENPDCDDCDEAGNPACAKAAADVEMIICGDQMPLAGAQEGDTLYEMCCNCGSSSAGTWVYRTRTLHYNGDIKAWECPQYSEWQEGLPPDTGIALPAPLIVGGLLLIGAGFLGLGVVLRRRTARPA